jgi:hypothetical protein
MSDNVKTLLTEEYRKMGKAKPKPSQKELFGLEPSKSDKPLFLAGASPRAWAAQRKHLGGAQPLLLNP